MATLVAIRYPDQTTAEQARQTAQTLEADLIIKAKQGRRAKPAFSRCTAGRNVR